MAVVDGWRLSTFSAVAYNAANERIDITDLLPQLSVPILVIHEPAFPFGSSSPSEV